MKIIQSYWSKPNRRNDNQLFHANTCGWLDKKYNYFAWALSCLNLRKYYNQVELITDDDGHRLLIDKLELPYTAVRTDLGKMDRYDGNLWAMGKLYAYSLQKEPFLHVDGDIFIWQKFDTDQETAPLLVQQLEVNFSHYGELMEQVSRCFTYLPTCLKTNSNHTLNTAVNAGVIGGTDLAFFSTYTAEAFRFVDENKPYINYLSSQDLFNTIYEQLLFYRLAETQQLPIACCYEGNGRRIDGLFALPGTLPTPQFTHAAGDGKRSKVVCSRLENRLRNDYPDYYYMILHKLRTLEI